MYFWGTLLQLLFTVVAVLSVYYLYKVVRVAASVSEVTCLHGAGPIRCKLVVSTTAGALRSCVHLPSCVWVQVRIFDL